jgi:hypothetical protein
MDDRASARYGDSDGLSLRDVCAGITAAARLGSRLCSMQLRECCVCCTQTLLTSSVSQVITIIQMQAYHLQEVVFGWSRFAWCGSTWHNTAVHVFFLHDLSAVSFESVVLS